ncbi:MAG: DUF1294 domain-containing protein [Planctomycetota bacterium]
MLRALAVWLVAINAVTYLLYWWDKHRAVNGKRRISERELLLWALAGGSPAAFFAMRKFRHKTQKSSFRAWYWAIVVGQVGLVVWLVRQSVD